MHSKWDAARFRELLDGALTASGKSQRELAALTGVSHSQISRWKSGQHQPDYDNVCALAIALMRVAPQMGNLAGPLLTAAGYDSPILRPLPPEWRRRVAGVLPDPEDQIRVLEMLVSPPGANAAAAGEPQDESRPQAGL